MPQQEVNRDKIKYDVHRKKRIARLKRMLIFIVVIFLLIPTVFCTILFFRIGKLEKQVKILSQRKSVQEAIHVSGSNIKEVQAADSDIIDSGVADWEISDFNDNELKDVVTGEDEIDDVLNDIDQDEEDLEDKTEDDSKKKVYLTFDDGPSENTELILDILAEHNVKATFFVIGKEDEHSISMYKRIVDEGHTLAMHSYSHRYNEIYKSVKSFSTDTNKLKKLLFDVTGVEINIYRFPGGSSNIVSKIDMKEFVRYLNNNDYVYFDWNVSNGDATSSKLSKNQLVKNVINDVKKFQSSIVLMHDSKGKESTVESLPFLIKELNKLGVIILPLDETVRPIQHLKADKVK